MVYKGRQYRQNAAGNRVQYLIVRGNRLAAQIEQLTQELAAAKQRARDFQAGRSLFQMSNNDRDFYRMLSHNVLNINIEIDRIWNLIHDNDEQLELAFNHFNLTVQNQDDDTESDEEN